MKTTHILSLAALGLFAANLSFAQTWTPTSAPTGPYYSIASSADGSVLLAGPASTGDGMVSTNFGVTWTIAGFSGGFWRCAASADGSVLLAAWNEIRMSTNSGADWTTLSTAPAVGWNSIACSADGTKLAGLSSSQIFTSTNSGATWITNTIPSVSLKSIASSADGAKLVAVGGDSIYTSTNFGVSWRSNDVPQSGWQAVASSSNGKKLIAVSMGLFETTTNGGLSWTSNSAPAERVWDSVASSADGKKLITGIGGTADAGPIYISTNSGASWFTNDVPKSSWFGVCSSADGNRLAAATTKIYASYTPARPTLAMRQTNGNATISWLVPSTNFVVQQNTDLSTTNWVDMTNIPVLNLTNLQDEVTVPRSESNTFFRLKTP